MKILYLHNEYRSSSPSGENQVVKSDFVMLRELGVDIDYLTLDSDSLFSQSRLLQICNLLKTFIFRLPPGIICDYIIRNRPDIVHIHNTFPLVGFKIFRYLHNRGIKIVLTIHNTRISCLNSTHFRRGSECNKCSIDAGYMWGIIHACFQHSRLSSVYLSLYNKFFVHSFSYVDHFVVLNNYSRELLLSQGIPSSAISKRVPIRALARKPLTKKRQVLFAGRLTEEKGVNSLLEAWGISNMKNLGWMLAIAGAGHLEHLVRQTVKLDSTVSFFGFLNQEELAKLISESSILCLPSKGYEGFPSIIAQAAESGVSVISSNIGPLTELSTSWVTCVDPEPLALAKELDAHVDLDLTSKFEDSKKWFQRMQSNCDSGKDLLSIYSKVRSSQL